MVYSIKDFAQTTAHKTPVIIITNIADNIKGYLADTATIYASF